MPGYDDMAPTLAAPEQCNQTVVVPNDQKFHTIHLFPGHQTRMWLNLENHPQIGSTVVLQLYALDSMTYKRTALSWDLVNIDAMVSYGLKPLPHADDCPFCLRFEVVATSAAQYTPYPELDRAFLNRLMIKQRWFGRQLKNIPLDVLYTDSVSSWATSSDVRMLFKIITPIALHGRGLVMVPCGGGVGGV